MKEKLYIVCTVSAGSAASGISVSANSGWMSAMSHAEAVGVATMNHKKRYGALPCSVEVSEMDIEGVKEVLRRMGEI
jgi:hypothetical protein